MTLLPATVVMASSNAGKIREISRLLQPLNIHIVAQSEYGISDALETGTSFAENSLLKARHACDATGMPAIADDSGLVVGALAGAPGVYSARYAGDTASDNANIDKLLTELSGIDDRTAAFHCVATMVQPDDDKALVATGVWQGSILKSRQGRGGFGYDPIFLDQEKGCSAAELSAREKNLRSHRGIALRELVALMQARFA